MQVAEAKRLESFNQNQTLECFFSHTCNRNAIKMVSIAFKDQAILGLENHKKYFSITFLFLL